jgi:mannose-1-phosphate guanylyltransferase/mannose-6-phosphate isomerase
LIVVSGLAQVTCGDKIFPLKENQSTYIPLGENTGLRISG